MSVSVTKKDDFWKFEIKTTQNCCDAAGEKRCLEVIVTDGLSLKLSRIALAPLLLLSETVAPLEASLLFVLLCQ